MNEILIEMAQRAGKNEALCAGLIRKYGERRGMQWEEIARQLNMDSACLAKLALCRLPRPNHLDQEVGQIAAYLGVRKNGLLGFFQTNIQPYGSNHDPSNKLKTSMDTIIPKRYIFALAMVAVILLVGSLIAFIPQPSTATLVVTAGQATIQTSSRPELVVTSGQAVNVKTGDSLALKQGAVAQLRFYDGSTIDLSENTQVEVQELATSDDQFRVRLKMLTGRTVSRVLRLLGVGDTFEISTPSSTVSVRGTVFVVQVLDSTLTYVGCDKGIVWVTSGSQQAEVKAGQELEIQPDQPPVIKPKPTKEPAPLENDKMDALPNDGSIPDPASVNAGDTPAPAAPEALNPNGGQSTPVPPAVTSGPSGAQSTPKEPGQVPGKPPDGGQPPGQTQNNNNGNNGNHNGDHNGNHNGDHHDDHHGDHDNEHNGDHTQ